MWIKDIGPNLFLFHFYHELDLQRVIKNGPWTFDQKLLVFSRLEIGMDPQQVQLNHADFWVQVYDLPVGFMSKRVAVDIGNFIGNFVETYPNNFMGVWRSYMCIRVSMDISKPLRRRMKIRKSGEKNDGSWANFKYEKLPNFCFFCGLIGDSDHFCEKFFDYPNKSVEKLFGTWLRAPNRWNLHTGGERWLRDETAVTANPDGSDRDKMVVDLDNPIIRGSSINHNPHIRGGGNLGGNRVNAAINSGGNTGGEKEHDGFQNEVDMLKGN